MKRASTSSVVRILLFTTLTAVRCNGGHAVPAPPTVPRGSHIANASLFTQRYEGSRLKPWHVRGRASGSDCAVLFVETSVVMEESTVEALHYGSGAYNVVDGGVQEFLHTHGFRGVVYKDATGRSWPFDVSAEETTHLAPCQ
jgi:hypothetical protein